MLRRGSKDESSAATEAADRRAGAGVRSQEAAQDGGFPEVVSAECQESMASLIADQVIPRLVAAHCTLPASAESSAPGTGADAPVDHGRIADLAISPEPGALIAAAEAALAAGLPYERLMLDVLAPAARLLGRRWEDDSSDFIAVTLGLWRLQEAVYELSARQSGGERPPARASGRTILCAVAPDDDHSLGSVMLEDFFRRAGWRTVGVRGGSREELMAMLAADWFDILALTVSVERNSGRLHTLVGDLRRASRNPGISIMVGGSVFVDQPELADAIGADATAADARGALHKAELLVAGSSMATQRKSGSRLSGAPPESVGFVPG